MVAASSSFTAQAVAFASDTQDVNNHQTNDKQQCGCKIIERIPPGHGLMIMLNDENSSSTTNNQEAATTTSRSCSCLKLQSQKDTNYPSLHPNIYIPTALTQHPTHLRKYSGGGSGVTVFGGYHPQLGSLVMKHGGYKDLIELVSLAKIEREVVVRGRWRVDA